MRLVFVNRFFPPDHSATSAMLGDLAEDLAAHVAGRDVEVWVITSRLLIDDTSLRLPARERRHGVEVRRAWSSGFGRGGLAGRSVDCLSFYLGAGVELLRCVRRNDLVIACTDPPMISVLASVVATLRGAKLVNWLHDLFPEIAHRLGVLPAAALPALRWLRDVSLRRATRNVVLGEAMAREVQRRGVAPERIAIVHNWCDPQQVVPVKHADNPLREHWGLSGQFVVGYSGNLGRAHDFEGIVQAAKLLLRDTRIHFLFIGGGAQFERLRQLAADAGLGNMSFKPYQPRSQLTQSLGCADLHLVCLRPDMEGLIVPSKFYGIAAAGRACLVLGAADGEIASVVTASRCGAVYAPGDGKGIAAFIERMQATPSENAAMGQRARECFEQNYARPIAFARWCEVLGVA